MFTGIITDIGQIEEITPGNPFKLVISVNPTTFAADYGASICCSGVCLSVVTKEQKYGKNLLGFDVSAETINCTSLGLKRVGDYLNLERSLKFSDELGGHVVSGHVDACGIINKIQIGENSHVMEVIIPDRLRKFVVGKGSIAIDGVSLTVNDIEDSCLRVNLIPVTVDKTTFKYLEEHSKVNIEVDLFARYIAKMLDERG